MLLDHYMSSKDYKSIKESFLELFHNGDIYLFGSRVDDAKKGGDIDLYIIPAKKFSLEERLEKKRKFRLRLENKIGEQKIDIVISKDKNREIEIEALETGIKL